MPIEPDFIQILTKFNQRQFCIFDRFPNLNHLFWHSKRSFNVISSLSFLWNWKFPITSKLPLHLLIGLNTYTQSVSWIVSYATEHTSTQKKNQQHNLWIGIGVGVTKSNTDGYNDIGFLDISRHIWIGKLNMLNYWLRCRLQNAKF